MIARARTPPSGWKPLVDFLLRPSPGLEGGNSSVLDLAGDRFLRMQLVLVEAEGGVWRMHYYHQHHHHHHYHHHHLEDAVGGRQRGHVEADYEDRRRILVMEELGGC